MERAAAPEGVEAKKWDVNGKKAVMSVSRA